MEANTLAQRLERGELLVFNPCPFDLPRGGDRDFLCRQELQSAKKNISFNPHDGSVSGFVTQSDDHADRLARILGDFSRNACGWLQSLLPGYTRGWRLDRASFRPEEEATRKLRLTARNDLLHIDAFPSRPSQGCRILRLYVNIHPSESRVWATSDTFGPILEKYADQIGLPHAFRQGWAWRIGQGLLSLFQPGSSERTVYDQFMLKLHHFLKTHEHFQDRAAKRIWHFAPDTAWLAFTDSLSHAELRGRFALEHSFFLAPHTLVAPEESPAALLERACGVRFQPRAA